MEAAGRSVVSPLIAKGQEYVSKIRNVKFDTYLKAVENKGDEIIEALRGKTAAVPGSAPTAGQVAAPVGSVPFSTLQAQAAKVPAVSSEYATAAAQTNEARLAQQARVDQRFQNVADRVKAKIDRNLTSVSQRLRRRLRL